MPENPIYPELHDARAHWRYQPPGDLMKGRVVLVTGAGSGIGRTAARTFAHYGADVVLLGRSVDKLERLSDEIVAETATDPTIVPCDFSSTDFDNYRELAEAILRHYGRLDGLLHNASRLGTRVPLEHYASDEWRRVMRVNLDAPVELTRALLPALRHSSCASVVFTSSSVGRKARAYWGAYAVSKTAIEAASVIFAEEHEHEGIRFATLNPGATRTAMRAAAYPGEDPFTVPIAEARMDIYLFLLGPDRGSRPEHQFDARDWTPL